MASVPPEGAHLFGEVLLATVREPGLDPLLRESAQALCRATDLQRCAVYLPVGTTGRFRGRMATSPALTDAVRRIVIGGSTDRFTSDVVRAGHPVFVRRARADPRLGLAVPRAWNTASLLAVPVLDAGRTVAVCVLDAEFEVAPSATDALACVAEFAAVLGPAITRTTRAERLPAALRTMEAERRTTEATASLAPELSVAFRAATGDRALLQLLADKLGRPVVDDDLVTGLSRRTAPTGAPAPDRTIEPATIAHLTAAARTMALGTVAVLEPSLPNGIHRRWVIAPIVSGGRPTGVLAVEENPGRLTGSDVWMVQRIADALGDLADRVDAAPGSGRHLRYADRLGVVPRTGAPPAGTRHDDRDHHVTFLAPKAGAPVPPDIAARLERELAQRRRDHGATVLRTDDGLVVLVPAAADEREAEVCQALMDALERIGLEVDGAGMAFAPAGEHDLAPVLADARSFARWSRTSPGPPRVATGTTLGPARLVATDPQRAERLAREVLGKLLTDDTASSRELLETTTAYLAHGCATKATSESLGIHENTVRNRLGRVREITGRDVVGDGGDRFLVHAALLSPRASRTGPR